MTKAWCIWCEMGEIPKHGYYWIHPECFEKIHSIALRIEQVDKYLKGELPRISKDGNKLGYVSVENFLAEMADFDRRSRNVMKLMKSAREGTPLEPFESTPIPKFPVWICSKCGYENKVGDSLCDKCYELKPVKTSFGDCHDTEGRLY